MSRQLQPAKDGCRSCNMTVPNHRYIEIKTATKVIRICSHHGEDWMAKVKETAESICSLAGPLCNNITDLSGKVRRGASFDEVACHAEQLLEAVYKKAGQLRESAKGKLADLRKSLFQLAHLLGYVRTAEVFI